MQAQETNPLPVAAPAQKDMAEWIATNDVPWQAAYKRDVTDVHEAELGNLKRQYLAALEAALGKASSASDLKGALALRDEQKRFTETRVLPEPDEATEAASVKQLRAAFRPQFARVENEAAGRAKALYAKYDQALAQAQAQLTQRQRLDDAVLVQKKREEVAAAWIKPGVPEKASPPAPAPVVAKTAATPAGPAVAKMGATPASPDAKSADDAKLTELTRTAWTWNSPPGKDTIKFAKDGTCVNTRFAGSFSLNGDKVIVSTPTFRKSYLTFDFEKGEFTGYDSFTNQKITGRRTNRK